MSWQVVPAYHTIALVEGHNTFRSLHKEQLQNDMPMDEPPLPIALAARDISELRDERVVACTHYGPRQDKAQNEDFAISGVIRSKADPSRECAFVVVADGVSTKTFWAARTSRIACFGVYRALRDLIDLGMPIDATAVESLRSAVASVIRGLLEKDFWAMQERVPFGWDQSLFAKLRDQRAYWYRSTLMFAAVSREGGLIGFAGDGGLRRLQRKGAEMREICTLRSTANVELDRFVSLDFAPAHISATAFSHTSDDGSHLVLSTDGVDKTLQLFSPDIIDETRRNCHSRYRDLKLGSREDALAQLTELSAHPLVDLDNLSVARLSWPLDQSFTNSRWGSWKQTPLTEWTTKAASHLVGEDALPLLPIHQPSSNKDTKAHSATITEEATTSPSGGISRVTNLQRKSVLFTQQDRYPQLILSDHSGRARYQIRKLPFLIGRLNCDLNIDAADRHARIMTYDRGFLLQSLCWESGHLGVSGIFVNGALIRELHLEAGSRFEIAHFGRKWEMEFISA